MYDQKEAHKILKEETLSVYSKSGKVECNCCGISYIKILTLAHLNDDGAKERRKLGLGDPNKSTNRTTSGWRYYMKLRNQGYPKRVDLCILCFNCNNASKKNYCYLHKKRI